MIIVLVILFILLTFLIGRILFNTLNKCVKINKVVWWIIYSLLAYSYLIYSIFKTYFPHVVNKILAFISSYYLSLLPYLTIFFILSFILSNLIKPKKIDFYIISIFLSLIIVLCGVFCAKSTYIKKYDITTEKNLGTDELKIALVSDIHLGDLIGSSRLNILSDKLNSLDADVVIIAGDFVDGDLDAVLYENMLDNLKNIKSTYGTYFSLGNHDFYTEKQDELCNILKDKGINVLRNDSILINDKFYIMGRDDIEGKMFGINRPSLESITSDLDVNKFSILIDHNPKYIKEAEENNIDLQVSGHTHKGQIIPGNLVTKAIYPLDYGYGKFGNTNLVVSSGFGQWATAIRTGSRSEIVLITIHN